LQTKGRPVKQQLFACAETNDVNGLRRLSKEQSVDWNGDNGALNLMQMAVSRGSKEVVAFLLHETSCDPNAVSTGEGRPPVLLAAKAGLYSIISLMKGSGKVDFTHVDRNTGRTVLHEALLGEDSSSAFLLPSTAGMSSRVRCISALLKDETNERFNGQISKIVNYKDKIDGNTALHLATMQVITIFPAYARFNK